MSIVSIGCLPGYSMSDCTLIETFKKDVVLPRTESEFSSFIERWKLLWEVTLDKKFVPEHVKKMDQRIINLEFDVDWAWTCIQHTFVQDVLCVHATSQICPGAEIAIPCSLINASFAGTKFGVSTSSALHQLFCNGPHDCCF